MTEMGEALGSGVAVETASGAVCGATAGELTAGSSQGVFGRNST